MNGSSVRLRRLACYAAVSLTLAFALLEGWRPLDHDDVFFHLRGGEITVRDHAIPMYETFSYTRPGERWITHEWGFGVLVYLAYRAGGLAGLVLLQSALTAALAGAVLWLVAASSGCVFVPLLVGAWVVQFGLVVASHYLSLRAMLLGSIFLACELALLGRLRATGERVWLLLLGLVFIVWPNVHGGVLFGLAILGLAACEGFAAGRLGPRLGPFRLERRRPLAIVGVLAVGCAAVVAGPNHLDVLLYPLYVNRFVFGSGLHLDLGHFTPATPENSPFFFLSLGALLTAFLAGRRDRLTWFEVVCVAGFAVLTLRSHRFVLDYTVVAAPVLAKLAAPLALGARRRLLAVLGLAASAALVAATGAHVDRRYLAPWFPQGAAAFIESEGIGGNLFHPQNFGGYLGWRLGRPVFWDGRNVEFAALTIEMARDGFQEIVEHYDVDVVLVTEAEYTPIVHVLTPDRWALVYNDDDDAIFVRRRPLFADLIRRNELTIFPPFGSTPGLEALAKDPAALAKARAELDHVLSIHPTTRRALFRKGILSFYEGDLARAQRELQQALDLGYDPNIAGVMRRVLERRLATSTR